MTMPGFNQQDGQQLTPDVIARRLNALEGVPRPYILAQSGVPLILPSSGSSNASGQITLTTALPYQPVGVVQIYLPAAVVVGDATGGMKSVIFSSTTVCQIVGNPVTANGAYTQSTGAVVLGAVGLVPGNAMGANGGLRINIGSTVPNNANGKSQSISLGGTTVLTEAGLVSTAGIGQTLELMNRGSVGAQWLRYRYTKSTGQSGVATAAQSTDTSVAQALTFSAQLAVATDYIIVDAYTVEVLPGA